MASLGLSIRAAQSFVVRPGRRDTPLLEIERLSPTATSWTDSPTETCGCESTAEQKRKTARQPKLSGSTASGSDPAVVADRANVLPAHCRHTLFHFMHLMSNHWWLECCRSRSRFSISKNKLKPDVESRGTFQTFRLHVMHRKRRQTMDRRFGWLRFRQRTALAMQRPSANCRRLLLEGRKERAKLRVGFRGPRHSRQHGTSCGRSSGGRPPHPSQLYPLSLRPAYVKLSQPAWVSSGSLIPLSPCC